MSDEPARAANMNKPACTGFEAIVPSMMFRNNTWAPLPWEDHADLKFQMTIGHIKSSNDATHVEIHSQRQHLKQTRGECVHYGVPRLPTLKPTAPFGIAESYVFDELEEFAMREAPSC